MTTEEIKVKLTAEGTQQSGGAFQKAAADVKKVGDASGYTKGQMQQLSFQMTDIVTSLGSGQSPFTVLLQQGGQLKDAFGGIGGALRAVGSGIVAAITPLPLLGGVAAALTAGFVKGRQESAQLRDAILLSGNAAGVTADSIDIMVKRVASLGEVSQGTARELSVGLVGSGAIGAHALDTVTTAAARLQAVTGESSETIVKDFAGMSSGVADWAAQHNKAWHFVSSAQLAYIRTLEESGDTEQAMIVAGQALIDHLGTYESKLGLLERAWRDMGIAASNSWESLKAIGRDDTTLQKLDEARNKLLRIREDAKGGGGGYLGLLVNGTEGDAQNAIDTANRDLLRGRENSAYQATVAAQQQQLESLRQLTDRLNGSNTQYAKDLREIQAAAAAGLITDEKRIELLERLAVLTGPKVQAAKQKEDRDPLGSFINDQLNAQARRDDAAAERAARQFEQREQQIADFGARIEDQTAQINASLILDDRKRGEAEIEIERQTMQHRLDLLGKGGADITAAQEALNANIVAKQAALTEQLKPQWQRMVDGWRDATRTMRETYDSTMEGVLRDSEDAFVRLMTTGKLDLKSLGQDLASNLWRGFFRQNLGSDVQGGAAKLFEVFGLSRGGTTPKDAGKVDDWSAEFGRLIGITDQQADATKGSTQALKVFGSMMDSLGNILSESATAVIQFVAALSGGSGGGSGGWLGSLWDYIGGSGSSSSGMTSGDKGLVDYGLGGGRALGGPVRPGFDYLVGENGPERLRMFRSGGGQVVPMGNGGSSGGGSTVHNHYYQAGVSPAQMQAYGEAIENRVMSRIYQDSARPGRPLYRAART